MAKIDKAKPRKKFKIRLCTIVVDMELDENADSEYLGRVSLNKHVKKSPFQSEQVLYVARKAISKELKKLKKGENK